MNLLEGLSKASEMCPDIDESKYANGFQQSYPDPQQFADDFANYRSEPTLYPNLATLISSPYVEDHWGCTGALIETFSEDIRYPMRDTRVDPNKIFTQDIAALRTLAADQIRVKKLFEKRLTESLKDKDKYGLTELDILAMQALTAANNAVTSINEKQINIKKSIADLRIKQSQQQGRADSNGNISNDGSNTSAGLGRGFLDNIFKLTGDTPVRPVEEIPFDKAVEQGNLDRAADVLDSILPGEPTSTKYEDRKPVTYVVTDESGKVHGYETYDSEGNLIEDYDNPTAEISTVDISANIAVDEFSREWKLKVVNND